MRKNIRSTEMTRTNYFNILERPCRNCGNPLPTKKRPNAKYCSHNCQREYHTKAYRKLHPVSSISTGTTGVIGEYRVIIDLLSKGYEVFHATSPSCSCDLIALKNEKLHRLEVRTGYYDVNGKPYCDHRHKADIIVIVLPDKLFYDPNILTI